MISNLTFTKRLVSFVLALIFISTQFAFAQENVPVPTPPPPLTAEEIANPPAETEGTVVVLIATVNIYDAVIQKQDGRTVSVAFTLSNREGVQPDITYAAHLIASSTDQYTTLDVGVFPAKEKVMLRENDNQAKTLTFTVPDSVAAGEYSVEIWASNSSGINLARQKAGKVTLPKSNGGIILRGNQCVLHIAEETPSKDYSPFVGIDIAQNENMILDCFVTNTMDRTLQVAPTFATYRRNIASGVQVDTSDVSNDPIILTAGETKKISFRLPKATLPQAYDVSVALGDHTGALISDTVIVHYVVRGVSGTIQNLLLDKDSYTAGDTASATVTFSRSADRFPGARLGDGSGTSIDLVNIELSLVDMNAQACANPVTRSMSKEDSVQQNFSFPVTSNCEKPTVTVKLIKADDGTVLDTVSASLAPSVPSTDVKPEIKTFVPQNEPLFTKESLIIGAIVLILLILLGVFGIKLARSKGWMLGIVFLFILGLSGVSGVDEVRADTIYTTSTAVVTAWEYVWNPLGGCYLDVENWTITCPGGYEMKPTAWGYVFGSGDVVGTYSLNKSTYAPGETMIAYVSFQHYTCSNSYTAGGEFYVRPHQTSSYALEQNTADSHLAEGTVSPQPSNTWRGKVSSLWRVPNAEAGTAYLISAGGNKSFTVANWSGSSHYATFRFRVVQYHHGFAYYETNFYRNIPYTISKTPTVTFTASPGSIVYNTASTLTWSSTDATSCTAGGAWSGSKGTSGSYSTGNLTTSQTYTLYCTGPAGNSTTQTVTVSIIPIPVITSFTASPNPVAYNTGSTLTWSSTGATSCTATGAWSGVKASSGSYPTGNLTTPKTYTLTCTGPGGTSAPQTVTVNVNPPPTPVITSFTASPNPVAYNTASTLTWSSTDAASCTASSDWSGVKAVSGNQSTGNLTTPKTYTLTCTGPGGTSAPQSVTVTVLAPLPDLTPLSFTATVPSTGGTFFNGENIVLSGSMKNNGFLATVSAFDNNFSYRWNGTGFWTNITPYTNHPAGFAVGATAVDNATLNPSGSGQLNIQYCVDSSNSIPENNPTIGETNNCIVTDFTVHPKPTGNLTITSPVAYNTSSNISWTTNNPDPAACIPRVTGTGGPWSGLSGTKVSPLLTSDTLYSLTCAPYPGVLDSKLVDVNTDVFIKASPRLVNKGQTSTVTWGTGMEANCSIIANSVTVVPSTTGLGSRTDTISANTTYTIDCPNVDQTVKVEVQGYGQES